MRPKIIHYCWFGGNPKSKLIIQCMNSWKKYCPDYEIIEWNENNFDVNCCDYVREAYKSKKWAFVSDYCRFYILYHQGGVYLDTDVELIKNFSEMENTFVGFESEEAVNSGLIRAAEKGDTICKLMLESYHADHFCRQDGSLNTTTVCERETGILCQFGLKLNNQLQTVESTTVYPSDYFNPTDIKTRKVTITPRTVSIHHYAASWLDSKKKMKIMISSIIYRLFGVRFVQKFKQLIGWNKKH